MAEQLIDTARIATLLGCSRRHATERVVNRPDFPAPVVNVTQKLRRWSEAQVLAWRKGGRK